MNKITDSNCSVTDLLTLSHIDLRNRLWFRLWDSAWDFRNPIWDLYESLQNPIWTFVADTTRDFTEIKINQL